MGRAVAGQTKTFGIELGSVANAGKFQVNPTLDAADFRISINGGSFTALTNTPTVSPAGGAQVVVVLAAAETTAAGAGGRIHFRASDSSGNEWQDLAIDFDVYANAEETLVTLADNAITANKIATDAITAAKIADGAIDAATFAAGAINAAAIATDAIAAAKVASDAVTKIQNGLATPTNITAGTITTVTNLTNAPTNGDLTATMKASVTTAASNATPSVTVSDKTGFRLSSAGVQDIWDVLTSALTTVGSIGKLLVDNINATISSRSSHTAANVRTEMDSNSTQLAKLGTPAGASLAADVAAIKSDTAAILDDTGTSGVVVATGSKTGYALSANQSGVTIGTVNALGTQAKADVNAEVVDAINVDTYAEPTSVPAATSSLAAKIRWLFALSRNKVTQDATTQTLRNDADSANVATSAVSDDGTTMTRGEWS